MLADEIAGEEGIGGVLGVGDVDVGEQWQFGGRFAGFFQLDLLRLQFQVLHFVLDLSALLLLLADLGCHVLVQLLQLCPSLARLLPFALQLTFALL